MGERTGHKKKTNKRKPNERVHRLTQYFLQTLATLQLYNLSSIGGEATFFKIMKFLNELKWKYKNRRRDFFALCRLLFPAHMPIRQRWLGHKLATGGDTHPQRLGLANTTEINTRFTSFCTIGNLHYRKAHLSIMCDAYITLKLFQIVKAQLAWLIITTNLNLLKWAFDHIFELSFTYPLRTFDTICAIHTMTLSISSLNGWTVRSLGTLRLHTLGV